MAFNWNKWTRKTHYWGAAVIAVPTLVIICSGLLLQLKKEINWIQPPSQRGQATIPTVSFDRILESARSVPQANVSSWDDIDRLDVRPQRGLIKIRTHSSWEIQLDHDTGAVLQTAYRRSDFIEDIHDGSFFHDAAKLWIFLPTAGGLLLLWITGVYLFILPFWARWRKQLRA